MIEEISKNQNISIEVKCKFCGSIERIVCKLQDYKQWKNRKAHIQDVMNYLSSNQRELLISGVCGECFDAINEGLED